VKSIQDEVMSCEAFLELVTDYLEEALPTQRKAKFEQHMHFCEGCVTYLDQIRATSRLLRREAPAGESERMRAETLDKLVEVFRRLKPPQEGT
jgi:hypothetical protein